MYHKCLFRIIHSKCLVSGVWCLVNIIHPLGFFDYFTMKHLKKVNKREAYESCSIIIIWLYKCLYCEFTGVCFTLSRTCILNCFNSTLGSFLDRSFPRTCFSLRSFPRTPGLLSISLRSFTKTRQLFIFSFLSQA